MRRRLSAGKIAVVAALGGGMMFESGNGCLNALFSIPICGVVTPTTVCTPQDQLLLVFRYLQVPDFKIDPSCTIPFGCNPGGDGTYPFGGGPPTQPPTSAGGSGGTGGGGAGGGGGI